MPRDTSVLQVRLDEQLKRDFLDAAQNENTTPSRVVRSSIEAFVRESRRNEAQRQSRLVAQAADSDDTMDDVARAQGWIFSR